MSRITCRRRSLLISGKASPIHKIVVLCRFTLFLNINFCRVYKNSVAGALVAAADSGSDSAPGSRSGGEDFMRTSGGPFSARESFSRSVTMSLSRKDGGSGVGTLSHSGSLLRLSPGPNSPAVGDGDRSVSSQGSHMRRSLEQFEREDDLNGGNMFDDDAPMLASITSSSDFRRRAGSPSRAMPTIREAPPSRDTVGIAHTPSLASERDHSTMTSTHAPLLSESMNADSLMYSPSVSVSNTARSRYSTEEAENSDLDDSFVGNRPAPTSAVQAQRLPPQKSQKDATKGGGQGSKQDNSELEASMEAPIVTRWSSASASAGARPLPLGNTLDSLDDEPELRADSKKGARAEAGGKASDSVDSFKREYLAGQNQHRDGGGFKGEMSVTESGDRFRNTGDHTMMSSIPTLNDSVNSFSSDQEPDYFRDRRNPGSTLSGTLGGTTSTGTGNTLGDDLLSTTLDSEGDMLLHGGHIRNQQNHRGGGAAGGGTGGVRASEVGRRADAYERDAAAAGRGGSASKSNVEHFGSHHTGDDEGSINSLALSDSNNLDDL